VRVPGVEPAYLPGGPEEAFMNRKLGLGLGLLVILVGAGAVMAARGVNFTIRNGLDSNFCMDAKGDQARDGTPVNIYKCHGRENQRWTVTDSEGGKSAIVGIGGMCLDVRGGHSKATGTPIQLWKCHFGTNQRFEVQQGGHIVEVESKKCLYALEKKEGSPIVLDECGDIANEMWLLQK
jgi:hypothetical protein